MRIILGVVVSLAMAFSPPLAQAITGKKKTGPSSRLVRKTHKRIRTAKRSSRYRTKRRAKSRRVRRSYDRISPGASSVSRAALSGIGETPPLMRVIPQRDGSFRLEPLTPKKKVTQAIGPTSRLDSQKAAPPARRSHYRFEPWSFQDLILARAKAYCGTPYRMGASLAYSRATDCSGFIQYVFQGFKIELPRTSAEQAHVGKVVTCTLDFSKMLPGDLLFFRRRGRRVGHAGIYLGEGKMIHASSGRRRGVIITDLRQPYYQRTFVVAKRVFEVEYPDW
ncbi:MAG: C40 family peptidase [Deltaproteobacteria bacterium]|nr:C40 family peptidase [Deltaproteobacteria bacterium]